MSVYVHVRAATPLAASLYPKEGRVVLDVQGHNLADLRLFLSRAELVRLLDVVAAARDDLDAAIADAAAISGDTNDGTEGDQDGATVAA